MKECKNHGFQNTASIAHVSENPKMHYFEVPKNTQSMIADKILTEDFWKFIWKINIYMPY